MFVVKLDGAEVFRSEAMHRDSKSQDITVSIAGAQRLELITEEGRDNGSDWTIWGDPFLR